MSGFNWESRYVVFKLKDLEKYLPFTIMRDITNIGNFLAVGRKRDGKAPFNAVVVEQDWPEFDIARDLIEARVRREQAEGSLAVGQTIHYPGHEIDGSVIIGRSRGSDEFCQYCAPLREELRIADKIIAERTRVMNAIPPCPTHGNGCVPWALEWIADAQSYGPTMRPKHTPTPDTDTLLLSMQSDRAELSRVMREQSDFMVHWLKSNANPMGMNLYAHAQWLKDTSVALSSKPPRAQEAKSRLLSKLLPTEWTVAMHTAWSVSPSTQN